MNTQTDITDNEKDLKHLQGDTATLDLPDVADIPGQENIKPAPLGELADTTISSDDEEGRGLLDEERGTDADVTDEEIELLRRSAEEMPDSDDELVHDMALDDTDDDGEELNETSALGGDDLDVPGAELDDENEEIGEEDEENNAYTTSDNN